MVDDMRMRKLSPQTQSGYIRAVEKLAGYLGHSPDTATAEELRQFQLHLVNHGVSGITLNATITALKFLFQTTLDRADAISKMSTVSVPRKLPVVLSREEAARLIAAAGNPKYRAALSVAYGSGLRVSEVVALKVSDIDSTRMTLRVGQGKGHKDRYAIATDQGEQSDGR
jgi:integrase/recombinase XerD